jgi:outer membrane immunogenic protein
MTFKTILRGVALAFSVVAGVSSAGAESFNWSGFYVGLNAGSNAERLQWAYSNPQPANCCAPFASNADSTMYGAHFGYQHQFGSIVVGVEGSMIQPGNKFAGETGCISNGSQTCQAQITNILTVGPRLGVAVQNWLFYGDGGYATGRVNSQLINSNGTAFDAGSATQNGWYAGAGIEYAFSPRWVAGIEYQHIDLGTSFHASSADNFGPSPPGANGRNIGAKDDVVRARISYKFNWAAAEPAPLK